MIWFQRFYLLVLMAVVVALPLVIPAPSPRVWWVVVGGAALWLNIESWRSRRG